MKRIGIDLMGSDGGYSVFPAPVEQFLKEETEYEITLFGSEEALKCFADRPDVKKVVSREAVDMDDGLLSVLRKKDSSMAKMLDALKEGEIDGALSAGSTAGLMALAHQRIPYIEGRKKAALITALPTKVDKPFYLLDIGANAELSSEEFILLAQLGSEYAQKMGIKEPEVALLNIGSEEVKGDNVHKEAYQLLKQCEAIHFKGNIEGRDLFEGEADVVVCDGFSGNISLKTMEGVASFSMSLLKGVFSSNLLAKMSALLVKKQLMQMREKIDYTYYGGAALIGFCKPIVKAHGSSNEKAIYNAIQQVKKCL